MEVAHLSGTMQPLQHRLNVLPTGGAVLETVAICVTQLLGGGVVGVVLF